MREKKRILVTGAAGFMGSHLVDALVDLGHEVYGIDDLSGGYEHNINPNSTFIKLDLREKEKARVAVVGIKPKILFHLAADAAEGRSQFTPLSSTERNYLAYLNVLIPAIKSGMTKVILTSSMSVYGSQAPPFSETMDRKPDDIYGIAKASMEGATEVLSKVFKFKYTIIRPHNVYGPKQNLADPYRNVVGIFINRLLEGKNFFIYGDGNQKRAFTYIDDLTPYIVKAGFQDSCNGEIINIGPEKECTINELSDVVLNNFFRETSVPDNMKPEYLPFRPQEVKDAWCTMQKAKDLLGYATSVTLEEGVRKMIIWAKEAGHQEFKYLDNLEIVSKDTPVAWTKKLI